MSGKASVVHLKKKNGKIVNEYDVYIGRKINNKYWQLPQSKFCNPFSIRQYEMKGMNKEAARKASIKAYKKYLEKNTFLKAHLFELVGKRFVVFFPL